MYVAIVAIAALAPAVAFGDHSEEASVADAPKATCVLTRTLTIGSRGVDVGCVQEHLMQAGILPLKAATDYYGPITKAAVSTWQKRNGVAVTGVFGPVSRARLESRAAVPVSSVTTTAQVGPSVVHPPIDIADWQQPVNVTITLHPDSMNGYNLEIVPTHFRFAPEHVNGQVVANEGHAHLMINGTKIARVYGAWMHLDKALFKSGDNVVMVTLNANDHSDLSLGGVRVQATTTVTIN